MPEQINDGGPAFPVFPQRDIQGAPEGMSLRDYFAAKAMQTIIGSINFSDYTLQEKVVAAYQYADCMLEARQK